MIVVLGGMKGGSGKTTVATNLAVMRAQDSAAVLLVDADPQGSANDFTVLRNEISNGAADYTALHLSGRTLNTEVRRLMRAYDDIIIDAGGADLSALRAALAIADLFLVPFQPRSFDFWTLDRVADLVEDSKKVNPRLRACSFINRADPSGRSNEEAAEVLREVSALEYLPTSLGSRKAFGKAASRGLVVTELRPSDQKATREMTALFERVFS